MKIDSPLSADGVSGFFSLLGGPRGRLAARVGAATLAGAAAVLVLTFGSSALPPLPPPPPRATVVETEDVPIPTDGPHLGFRLERLVPPDALAFVSVSNVPEFLKRASETGLARALRDERVAPFVREVVAGLPSGAAQLRAIGLPLASGLVPSLRGEAAVALLGVKRSDGGTAIDAVFLADVSGRAAEVRAFLGMTLALGFITGRIETVKIAGVDAVVCRSGADTVAWCEHGGLLAVATSARALAQVLVRRPAMKNAPPGIPSLAAYQRGREGASLNGRVDYRAFVDVERLITIFLGKRAAIFRAACGIEGLRAAALAGRLSATVREGLFLDVRGAPGAKRGIVWALGGPRIGLDSASRMPPETILGIFGSVDGRDFAKGLADPKSLRSAPKALQILLSLMGRESVRRVLDGVRGEAAVAAWNEGHVGWFPRVTVVATVLDAGATERALEDAWRLMAGRMRGTFLPRRGRWQGDPEREVTVGFVDDPKLFSPLIGSPAYGLDGDTLVAGTAATAVCRVIGESSGLAATDGFRALLAELPSERSAFVYMNVAVLAEWALEPHGLAVLDAIVPGVSERVDRGKLPPGEVVAPYLGPAGVASARVAGGIRIDAVTPTGLAATLFAAYALSERARLTSPLTQKPKSVRAARPRP